MLALILASLAAAAPPNVDVSAGTSLGRIHADHDLYDPIEGNFRKLQWLPGGHLRLGFTQSDRYGVALELDGASGRAGPETGALLYAARLDISKPFPTSVGQFTVIPELSAGLDLLGVRADGTANGADIDPMFHWGVATTAWLRPKWGVRLDGRHVLGHRRTRGAGPASHLIGHVSVVMRLTSGPGSSAMMADCPPLSSVTPQVVAINGCSRAIFDIDLTDANGSPLLGGSVRVPGGAIFREGARVVGAAPRDVVLTASAKGEWNLEVWTQDLASPEPVGNAQWVLLEEGEDGLAKWQLEPFTTPGADSAVVGPGISLFRNEHGTWSLDPYDVAAQVPGAAKFLSGSAVVGTADTGLWLQRTERGFDVLAAGPTPPKATGISWTAMDGGEPSDPDAEEPSWWKATATGPEVAVQLEDGRILRMAADGSWSVELLETLTGTVSWVDAGGNVEDLPAGTRLERQADGSWQVVMAVEEEPPVDGLGRWVVEMVDEDVSVVRFTGTQPTELRTSDGYVLRQDEDGSWRLVYVDEDGRQGLVRVEEDGSWTLLILEEDGTWTVQVLDEPLDQDDLTIFTFLGAYGHEEMLFSFVGDSTTASQMLNVSPVPVHLWVTGYDEMATGWSWRLDGGDTTLLGGSRDTVIREVPPGAWRATVWADGIASQSRQVEVPAFAERVDVEFVVSAPKVQLQADEIVVLERLNFDVDEVVPTSLPVLQEVAATLLAHPELTRVEVQGHTDATGETEYNLQLSQNRVDAAVALLVAFGVEQERLLPRGYGESRPLTQNTSEEGRASNRRVQFIVLERAAAEEDTAEP